MSALRARFSTPLHLWTEGAAFTTAWYRAARGRARLAELLGDALEHRVDTAHDVLRRAADSRGGGSAVARDDELTLEVRRRLTREFKDAHYRQWLDEPLPTLRAHTPAGVPLPHRSTPAPGDPATGVGCGGAAA